MADELDGGAAFPCPGSVTPHPSGGEMVVLPERGLSLRDYFAATALAGLLSAMKTTADQSEQEMAQDFAAVSYVVADAMLAARRPVSVGVYFRGKDPTEGK